MSSVAHCQVSVRIETPTFHRMVHEQDTLVLESYSPLFHGGKIGSSSEVSSNKVVTAFIWIVPNGVSVSKT